MQNATDIAIDTINIVQLMQDYDQYMEFDSRIVGIKVIEKEEYDEDLVYRTIVISHDTAIYELVWEFGSNKDTNPKTLIGCYPLTTYGDYGSSSIQKYIAI